MSSILDSAIPNYGVKIPNILDSTTLELGCAAPFSWPFAYNNIAIRQRNANAFTR